MIKLFTHTDLDGIGCAILAKLAFQENVEIEYCNYSDINEKITTYLNNDDSSNIYITDISVNEEIAEKLDKRGNVRLLDHHPTALHLNKYNWCKVSIEDSDGTKTSGTKLFYHWLLSNNHFTNELKNSVSLEVFVEIVRNYDTWRWTELGEKGIFCKQINDLFYIYGREDFIEWCIPQIKSKLFPKLRHSDKMLLYYRQKEIDNYIETKNKQLIEAKIQDRTCGIVFAERCASELGNTLCKIHPEFDIIVVINMNGTVSYRTVKDDIDLGKFTQTFGGGGHPKAAGSTFSLQAQLNIIETIFGNEVSF